MISVSEAEEIINNNTRTFGVEKIPMQKSLGRIIMEEVRSDRPFPPFDRVMMDGIAFGYEAWSKGRRMFSCEGIQAAGDSVKTLSDPMACMEVMTGAVLPASCDTVVRYEDLEKKDNGFEVKISSVSKGQNVHKEGTDLPKDAVLISSGRRISAAEIGVLASVGKTEIKVSAIPEVAVISTGDELVEIDTTPAPHQIRKSNVYSILAGLEGLGVGANAYHLNDERELIDGELRRIESSYDVVLLSGGVSKGRFDFIPQVLKEMGVEKLFHGVSQRPGKPFWFGKSDKAVFFAFPGNPVSTFMCFRKYFVPWLRACLGEVYVSRDYAILDEAFNFSPQLNYFLQVSARADEKGRLVASPVAGGGSGDFGNLLHCNGFLQLPHDRDHFEKGESYPFIPFR